MTINKSLRDKTISHFHTDPKLIKQVGCKSSLKVGQIVYLDTDGFYKPALAISEQQQNIQGIIWSFKQRDGFLLKYEPGPYSYRFSLTKDFFTPSPSGQIDPESPNNLKIPGKIGDKLWLSSTIPGGLSNTKSNSGYDVFIGYKTDYGFIYRPELYICCIQSLSSISSSSFSSSSISSLISSIVSSSSSSDSSLSSSLSSLYSSFSSSLTSNSNISLTSNSSGTIQTECFYIFQSTYDCPTETWSNPNLAASNCSPGPFAPTNAWVKTLNPGGPCFAVYTTTGPCVPISGSPSDSSSSSESASSVTFGICPPIPFPAAPLHDAGDDICCPPIPPISSSSINSSISSSETSSETSSIIPSSTSPSNASDPNEYCYRYFTANYNCMTLVWDVVDTLITQCDPTHAPGNLTWIQTGLCQATRLVPSDDGLPCTTGSECTSRTYTPGVPAFTPLNCCSSSSNTSNTSESSGPLLNYCYKKWISNYDCGLGQWLTKVEQTITCNIAASVHTVWQIDALPTPCTASIYVLSDDGLPCTSFIDCATKTFTDPADPAIAPGALCCETQYCYQQYESIYNCGTQTWSTPDIVGIQLCSNTFGPGDLLWVTSPMQMCRATRLVQSSDGLPCDFDSNCNLKIYPVPSTPDTQMGFVPDPSCCPSSSVNPDEGYYVRFTETLYGYCTDANLTNDCSMLYIGFQTTRPANLPCGYSYGNCNDPGPRLANGGRTEYFGPFATEIEALDFMNSYNCYANMTCPTVPNCPPCDSSSSNSSAPSSSNPHCDSAPSLLTITRTINTVTCGSAVITCIWKLISSTPTTVTYSQIYYDSPAWSPPGGCTCVQLWGLYHYDNPNDNGPYATWVCTTNNWQENHWGDGTQLTGSWTLNLTVSCEFSLNDNAS